MNYNTDDIQRLAAEVAKLIQAGIGQKETESQATSTMAEFELAFREALRRIGAEALGIFLSDLQQTPESEITCECGGKLHYQRMRPAVTTMVFGKVEYSRAYYAGCSCRQGVAPLDKTYGLEAGGISSGLASCWRWQSSPFRLRTRRCATRSFGVAKPACREKALCVVR